VAVLTEAPYPTEYLAGCRTALLLFCAAFLGKQDAQPAREAGLLGSCVDTDADKLLEMATQYPDDWKFFHDDAFSFAARAQLEGRTWDVVSLDPFTNYFESCANLAHLWCDIANRVVIIGSDLTRYRRTEAPEGWVKREPMKRSQFRMGGYNDAVYWTILERDVHTS
jgi:hypothetical protein